MKRFSGWKRSGCQLMNGKISAHKGIQGAENRGPCMRAEGVLWRKGLSEVREIPLSVPSGTGKLTL